MATQPQPEPNRIEPVAPPESPPPSPEPAPPTGPDEAPEIAPDFDDPGIGPEEQPIPL
jgi:hypothetical protein